MSKKSYIKSAIKKFVNENSFLVTIYSNWYVGITNNPDRRDSEHGKRSVWKYWKADSVNDARSIEKYFLDKGMLGGTGGGTKPIYIYIYKESGFYS